MTAPAPVTGPLFDPYAFAVRVRAAVQRAGGVRAAEQASGISIATLSRVSRGWAQLSHENYLRLEAWMAGQEEAA